jgi:hypothetical protein
MTLLSAAQSVVAEIKSSSGSLTEGIRYANYHVGTYYTQSLSFSLLSSENLFYERQATGRDVGKSLSSNTVITSPCLHKGAKTL